VATVRPRLSNRRTTEPRKTLEFNSPSPVDFSSGGGGEEEENEKKKMFRSRLRGEIFGQRYNELPTRVRAVPRGSYEEVPDSHSLVSGILRKIVRPHTYFKNFRKIGPPSAKKDISEQYYSESNCNRHMFLGSLIMKIEYYCDRIFFHLYMQYKIINIHNLF